MRELLAEHAADAAEWCRGRSPVPRAILLAYLVYAGLRHLGSAEYSDLFGGLDFGIHELGHVVFGGLGRFLGALGGTFWQLAVPVIAFFGFLRQPDYFAVSVAGAWLSFSLFDVARYVADARAMALPLIGLVPDPEHDWNLMLGALGLLSADHAIAFLIRVVAFALWGASVAFGIWLLREMREGAPVKARVG